MEWLKQGTKIYIKGPRNDYVGKVVRILGNRIELEKAAWVADSGRLSEFIENGSTSDMEIEIVGRGVFAFDDIIEWKHDLFTKQV